MTYYYKTINAQYQSQGSKYYLRRCGSISGYRRNDYYDGLDIKLYLLEYNYRYRKLRKQLLDNYYKNHSNN